MSTSFLTIELTLQKNVADVYSLLEFEKVILDYSISTVKDLKDKLINHHKMGNPALTAGKTLTILQNIRENESLKPKFQVIYNQCVVLLVSVFGAAMDDLFRAGINSMVKSGKMERLNSEELKLSIGELAENQFNLTDHIGSLIVEKKDISFQDMKSVGRVYREYFNVKIEKDQIVHNIILAQACRHVIVHNAAKINDRLIKQVSSAKPRDIMPSLVKKEMVHFSVDEVKIIGNSILTYFKNLRGEVEASMSELA